MEPLPTSFWTEEIDVIALPKADGIGSQLPAARGNIAYIGPVPERALGLDIPADKLNPKGVLDFLHYYRAYKTDYELYCMREAQKTAVNGHRAAHEAFQSGMSEFDINQAYLTATGHRDTDVPYSNIVALNEHASVLHYTKLDHQVPSEMRSFLLDAGAEYNGYAADLTRTWAANADTDFAQLIKDVNDEQLALIGTMKAGTSYVDYHVQFHQRIAKLLRKHQIVKDMSEEARSRTISPGHSCRTVLVTRWACRFTTSLALCRMIPVRILRHRLNILTCAAPVFLSRVWC